MGTIRPRAPLWGEKKAVMVRKPSWWIIILIRVIHLHLCIAFYLFSLKTISYFPFILTVSVSFLGLPFGVGELLSEYCYCSLDSETDGKWQSKSTTKCSRASAWSFTVVHVYFLGQIFTRQCVRKSSEIYQPNRRSVGIWLLISDPSSSSWSCLMINLHIL